MFLCPRCKKYSISSWSILCRPFNGRTQCGACGTVFQRAYQWAIFVVALVIPCWWLMLKLCPQPKEFELLWFFALGFFDLQLIGRYTKSEGTMEGQERTT